MSPPTTTIDAQGSHGPPASQDASAISNMDWAQGQHVLGARHNSPIRHKSAWDLTRLSNAAETCHTNPALVEFRRVSTPGAKIGSFRFSLREYDDILSIDDLMHDPGSQFCQPDTTVS